MLGGLISYLRQKNRDRLVTHRQNKRQRRRGTLAVLAIMKNESMNIDEWIAHYLQMGADSIVLIDNGSTDHTLEKARVWAERGRVNILLLPDRHRQAEHYWEAIQTFRLTDFEWLLVADLDEFWFCPDGMAISEKLRDPEFAETDVIYGNWQMFGSSGLVDHPASIRVSLVHRSPGLAQHCNTKYICRTSVLKVRANIGVHKIIGADSARTVSDNTNFHLYHYPIQSLEFFQKVKMTRGDALSAKSDQVRDMNYFARNDTPCTVVDRTLADLVDRGLLGSGGVPRSSI